MNKRYLAVLLAGLLTATVSSAAEAGGGAAAVPQNQQARRTLTVDEPYSATHTLTMHRLQADGEQFTRKVVTKMYRDSAGRTRRDMLDGNGEIANSFITGTDGAVMILDHRNRLVSTGGASLHAPALRALQEGRAPVAGAVAATRQADRRPVVEQLGERDIEGVTATGLLTRHHLGNVAGGVEISTETWFAKELGIALYTKNSDPKGESVIAIRDLDRSEPDPALFAVPDGYQSRAAKPGKNQATR